MKRLLPFILLNIVISAATTLLVLRWWDANQRANLPVNPGAVNAQSLATPGQGGTPAALPPMDQTVISIGTVVGAGDLNNEYVVLARAGEGDLQMGGWVLADEDGNRYNFPELVLNRNGSVRVYTRAGQNSVIELFWGEERAVWERGEQVTVLDWAGNVRASYTVP